MKPLQGNFVFFRIRASRGLFRLKHKTQGPSHIHIPMGKLLLRCLWKNGFPLQTKTGKQLSSPDDIWCPHFSPCCITEIYVPIDLRWVSQRISGVLLRMSSHFLYTMWNARLLWIQWRGNVLYLELIWVTPIYFAFMRWHQCSSLVVTGFLGILFSSIREIEVLYVFDGNKELLSTKCSGIGPHLAASGKSHEFSRVAEGTSFIFSSYGGDGHLRLGFVPRSQDSCLVMTNTSVT